MIVIHYPAAYKAIDNYVDSFNAQTGAINQKLKTVVVAAAKEIIRIYGASLLKKSSQNLRGWHNLPPLYTNNRQLATLIKCSPRSIQRYILKLRQANILTSKVHHGPNANYELWINPEILLIKTSLDVDTDSLLLKKPGLNIATTYVKPTAFKPKQTDWPLSYSGNYNNILKEVSDINFFEIDFSGNTWKIIKQKNISGNKNSAAVSPMPMVTSVKQNEDVLNMNVDLFWLTAKNLLYKYTSITKQQEQTAKRLIKDLYLHKTDRDLQAVHDMYIQRIKLAAEYVQKDSVKRYIPLPYLYFDPSNTNGFQGTEDWYWKTKKYEAEVERELLLEKLIRRYLNNDRLPIIHRQPSLKLYKVCEKRLAVYNDDILINRFYTAVLDYYGI